MIRSPATDVKSILPPDNGMRVGTCTAINQGTITVSVAGATITNCGVLSSYQPAINDAVAIIRERSSWLALGAIRASSAVMMRNRIDKVTNSSAVGTGGATMLTIPSTSFPNGRAYRVRFAGLMSGSVANQGLFQVFRNSTSGTVLFDARTPTLTPTGATALTFEATGYFVNISGATITDTIVLGLTATTGTVTVAGGAAFPFWLEVEDWADPTLYPNSIQL